jgi:hypothetical protein
MKVGNKYIWNWLVNMVFKPTFSLENLAWNIHVWSYNIKIIVYSKASPKNKFIFSLVEYIWHILESNFTLQKVGLKSYLHLEKSTCYLLLHVKFEN